MDGGDRRPALELEDLAPGGADPEAAAEESLAGGGAQDHEDVGIHGGSSAQSHCLQAATSRTDGRWWIRRLPLAVHLKCLTALVRYTSWRESVAFR